jgi:hypothetical protein
VELEHEPPAAQETQEPPLQTSSLPQSVPFGLFWELALQTGWPAVQPVVPTLHWLGESGVQEVVATHACPHTNSAPGQTHFPAWHVAVGGQVKPH